MKQIAKWFGAALLVAAGALPASAQLDIVNPTEPGFKVTKAQLGIVPPPDNDCPGIAKLNVWIFTNQPGTASFMIVRQGGNVSGPYQVQSVAGAGGVNLGTYQQNLNIVQPIEAYYRVVIPNSDVASNWVPLFAHC